MLKLLEKFLRFFQNTTPYGNIFKTVFQTFSSRHRVVFKFRENWLTGEIEEIVRCLPDKKNFGWLSSCR